MKIKIRIGVDGQIQIEVAEGSFAEATEKVEKVQNIIGSTAKIEFASTPEQHRHDGSSTESEHDHAH